MIEVIATLLRWLQLASNMILVGSCVFLAIAGVHSTPPGLPAWSARCPGSCVILLIGLLGILATTTAQATGISENAWRPDAWLGAGAKYPHGTHLGRACRPAPLIVLAIALYIRHSPARAGNTCCAPPSLPSPWPWAPWPAIPRPKNCRSSDLALCLAHHHWPASGSAPCRPSWCVCLRLPIQLKNPGSGKAVPCAPAFRPAPSSASMPCSSRAKKRSIRRPGLEALLRHGPAGHAGGDRHRHHHYRPHGRRQLWRAGRHRVWLAAQRQDRPARHRARDCRARPLHLAAAACPARRRGNPGSAQTPRVRLRPARPGDKN